MVVPTIKHECFAFLAAVTVLVGCNGSPQSDSPEQPDDPERTVVLWLADDANDIKGTANFSEVDNSIYGVDELIAPDIHNLGRAAVACGANKIMIDVGTARIEAVSFRSWETNSKSRDVYPTDLELVQCVRSRVPTTFAAGIARSPNEIINLDTKPFEALRSDSSPSQLRGINFSQLERVLDSCGIKENGPSITHSPDGILHLSLSGLVYANLRNGQRQCLDAEGIGAFSYSCRGQQPCRRR